MDRDTPNICSTAHCYERERTHHAWWLPGALVPLCDRCYTHWCKAVGVRNMA